MLSREVIAMLAVIALADAALARSFSYFGQWPRHHRLHHRHQHRHEVTPYSPEFCHAILTAFNRLPVRDLDTFVKSVPKEKRDQAARCIAGSAR